MNATIIHNERQAAIADRARMDAEIALEDELLAAEQCGREHLKAGGNPLIQPPLLARLLRAAEVDAVVARPT